MKQTHRAGRAASPSFLGVVLIALVVGGAFGCNQDRAQAVNYMNDGIEAFNANKTGAALENLERAMETDPTYAEPALHLGQLYHRKLDSLDKAEQAYREALQRDPQNPEIAYKLGAVLADKEQHSDAIRQFEQAVEWKEGYAKAWYRMGLSHRAEGEYPEAVRAFMEAIQANPRMKMDGDDPGGAAYHELGDLYNWYGFYDKALKVYENGIENNEGVARLYAGRGVAQMNLERYDDAIESFKAALELDDRHRSATFNLAAAYSEAERHDEAVELLDEYIDRSSDGARRAAAERVLEQLRAEREAASN